MPGEAAGRIPDAAWKKNQWPDTPEAALWVGGDMTNIAIGQGDILVTPLQLCNSYASIARQKIVTPHVFREVINAEGNVSAQYEAKEVEAQPSYEQKHRDRLLDGLMRVVKREGVFDVLPVVAAGKSGTAEVFGKDDYAWYVGFAPADAPKYCVACIIEQGGGGSATATNGVLHTLAKLYGVDAGQIEIRTSHNER
jgi:penicillin-binding protein 2